VSLRNYSLIIIIACTDLLPGRHFSLNQLFIYHPVSIVIIIIIMSSSSSSNNNNNILMVVVVVVAVVHVSQGIK